MHDKKQPIYKILYVQVLFAITVGILLGHFYPSVGASMKPLGDGFIKLIKMIIAPIIFCTIVIGIAGMGDMKKVGRVGGKALIYFEVVTTLALIIGLVVVNTVKPGVGMNADVSTLDTKAISAYATKAQAQNTVDFILNIILLEKCGLNIFFVNLEGMPIIFGTKAFPMNIKVIV